MQTRTALMLLVAGGACGSSPAAPEERAAEERAREERAAEARAEERAAEERTPEARFEPPAPAWERLNPPLGGHALFAIDGHEREVVVAGHRRILRTDDGETWTPTTLPADAVFRAVAVTEDAIVVGAHDGRLFRSDNHGDRWRALPRFSERPIADLDMVDARIVATLENERVVWTSADGGETWSPLPALPQAAVDLHVRSADRWLVVHRGGVVEGSPREWQPVFSDSDAARFHSLWVEGTSVDVLSQVDEDDSRRSDWTRLVHDGEGWRHTERSSFPGRPIGRAFVARHRGSLVVTGDGHETWTSLTGAEWVRNWTKADLAMLYALSVRAMHVAHGRLFAVTPSAILRSDDAGMHWAIQDERPRDSIGGGFLKDGEGFFAAQLSVLRERDWSRLGPTRESLTERRTRFGMTGCCGALLETSSGAWLAAGSHIWRSDNSGEQWRKVRDHGWPVHALINTERGILALGNELLRSTNDGRRWSTVRAGGRRRALRGGYASGDRVLLVGEEGYALRSDDGGRTFADEEIGEGTYWSAAASPEVEVAVGDAIAIRRGGAWRQLPLDAPSLRDVHWDRSSGRWFVVGQAGAIFVSGDGEHWEPSVSGTDETLYAVFGDESGRVVATGTHGIVLRLR
ncbi:MAG: hypothetical protein AAGE52_13375 [Myxococcota bacterium]